MRSIKKLWTAFVIVKATLHQDVTNMMLQGILAVLIAAQPTSTHSSDTTKVTQAMRTAVTAVVDSAETFSGEISKAARINVDVESFQRATASFSPMVGKTEWLEIARGAGPKGIARGLTELRQCSTASGRKKCTLTGGDVVVVATRAHRTGSGMQAVIQVMWPNDRGMMGLAEYTVDMIEASGRWTISRVKLGIVS